MNDYIQKKGIKINLEKIMIVNSCKSTSVTKQPWFSCFSKTSNTSYEMNLLLTFSSLGSNLYRQEHLMDFKFYLRWQRDAIDLLKMVLTLCEYDIFKSKHYRSVFQQGEKIFPLIYSAKSDQFIFEESVRTNVFPGVV